MFRHLRRFILTHPYLIGYNYIERSGGVTREFIMLPEFDRKWTEMGLTDKELKALQEELTINPSKGDEGHGRFTKNPYCI